MSRRQNQTRSPSAAAASSSPERSPPQGAPSADDTAAFLAAMASGEATLRIPEPMAAHVVGASLDALLVGLALGTMCWAADQQEIREFDVAAAMGLTVERWCRAVEWWCNRGVSVSPTDVAGIRVFRIARD